jgi:ketosteroid isomerase-like protein
MSIQLDESTFAAWLDGYKEAWEGRDPAAAAALFTADASYRETPFEPPIVGTEAIAAYWAKAVSGQRDVAFTWEILGCKGDQGLCHWHCAFTGLPGGEAIDLDGILRCTFADPHRVSRFDEWWHVRVVPR